MSLLPARFDMNASRLPSGEYIGRDSFAGCDTSKCASPPVAGTIQISPPETNAISWPSGEIAGSANDGRGVPVGRCWAVAASEAAMDATKAAAIATAAEGRDITDLGACERKEDVPARRWGGIAATANVGSGRGAGQVSS